MDGDVYRVVVAGELGPVFAKAFDGMTVTAAAGTTEIRGAVADQAELRGLLNRIDDFGLRLLSVESVASPADR